MVTEQDLTEYLINKLNEKLKQNDNDSEKEYIASNKCYFCYQNMKNNELITNKKKTKDYYQLDVLIYKKSKYDDDLNNATPLVVIEIKKHKYTSHDVIVYSDKAKRHKIMYPFIRYGFVVIDSKEPLSYKYFSHAENFDFAYLLNTKDENSFNDFFSNIIQKEIGTAEYKQEILYEKRHINDLKGYRLNFECIK